MPRQPDTDDTIEGTVERVVFRNPDNGWTVLRLDTERSPIPQTVVGHIQRVDAGERARFSGEWTVDRKHGRQFCAETCLLLAPSTLPGIEKFLGSGLIPGIGPVMAGRIVKRFGLDSLEVIESDPKRLAEVPGIGPKRAAAIRAAWVEKRAVKEVMIFLESVGVSPAFAHRIHERYGADAIRAVDDNPYRLATEIHGVGFLTADRIAKRLGISAESEHRTEAGLLHSLEELATEGNVFAREPDLLAHAADLLAVSSELLERSLDRLVLMGRVRREDADRDRAVYLPRLHRAEEGAARALRDLLSARLERLPFGPDEAVRRAEGSTGIALSPGQHLAFEAVARTAVTIVTGGPGTGKTTLLAGLVACLEDADLAVALAAPTGRAARRMAESSGRDARTIHRLLEFAPATMSFARGSDNPLLEDAVIVDEVSMVDVELFCSLLRAIRPGARLVLVGDPNQLPSVGPGTVLADLLSLGSDAGCGIAVVRLDEIFRQARSSLIVTGAHDVLSGREPRTGARGSDADLFMVEREDPEDCLAVLAELVSTRIPARFGLDPIEDIQVLSPMHKGLLGAANLNLELQDLLNPGGGEGRYRVGDKVMQVRNNYDIEVFNGDIGRITAIGGDVEWIEVRFPERTARYPSSELDQIALAYACSVHKSQGSEYPAAVVPLHTQHYVMLQRNLLYTAITRARRVAVLVGSRRALGIAVRNASTVARESGLAARTRSLLE